jgi:hypothetical protein
LAASPVSAKPKAGHFLVKPRRTVLIELIHGHPVATQGRLHRRDRYPLEAPQIGRSGLISQSGGLAPTRSGPVTFTGNRWVPRAKQCSAKDQMVELAQDLDELVEPGEVVNVRQCGF